MHVNLLSIFCKEQFCKHRKFLLQEKPQSLSNTFSRYQGFRDSGYTCHQHRKDIDPPNKYIFRLLFDFLNIWGRNYNSDIANMQICYKVNKLHVMINTFLENNSNILKGSMGHKLNSLQFNTLCIGGPLGSIQPNILNILQFVESIHILCIVTKNIIWVPHVEVS